MLVDHRTYRIKPGMTAGHLAIYEQYGFAAQTRHLGAPLAYMYAESGDVNTVVHQWGYEDAADRAKRRAAMFADPEWQLYLQKLNEFGLSAGAEDLADDPRQVLPDQAVRLSRTSHRLSCVQPRSGHSLPSPREAVGRVARERSERRGGG